MKSAVKSAAALGSLLVAGLSLLATHGAAAQSVPPGIKNIENVVVIYAENRSFDNLYGLFPGANGLQNVTPANSIQRDRDGSVLKVLPPVWGGLTARRA